MKHTGTRKHLRDTYRLIFPAILALVISACATTTPEQGSQPTESELLKKAQKAHTKGDLEAAAREYLRLADTSSLLKQTEYQLKAAEILLSGNYTEQAKRVLEKIRTESLHQQQKIRKKLLSAKISLANNNANRALNILNIRLDSRTPSNLQSEFYRLRAEAYTRIGSLLSAAHSQMLRSRHQSNEDDIISTQHALWQALSAIPELTLQQHLNTLPRNEFKGWINLNLIARATQNSSASDTDTMIIAWREQYPKHSATNSIIASLLARQQETLRYPDNIALLLPLTGPYSKPARSIRDGFLAARFQQNNITAPTIRIYNTDQFDTAIAAYQQAVKEGAELVIGPLRKNNVNALSGQNLPIPLLTLNYSEKSNSGSASIYQFGLSPEDEARQVAERAWLEGHNQAITFTPESDWGERVLEAFKENWEALGGSIIESQHYPSKDNDFSKQLRELLNINLSQKRVKALRRLVDTKLEFEPRRRKDADFVFLAAFPRQARLIRPQLKFHFAGALPVYATSHIFSGKKNRQDDRDIDGIIFPDMPWVLNSKNNNIRSLKNTINQLWPDNANQYSRFFALGIDAFNIIPRLNFMSTYQHEQFAGVTGLLRFTDENRIFRQLQWARFKNGLPRTP